MDSSAVNGPATRLDQTVRSIFRETLHRDILKRSEHSALGSHLAGTTFLWECSMARLLVNLVDGSVESPINEKYSEEEKSVSDNDDLSNIEMHVNIKTRGRPKGADLTANGIPKRKKQAAGGVPAWHNEFSFLPKEQDLKRFNDVLKNMVAITCKKVPYAVILRKTDIDATSIGKRQCIRNKILVCIIKGCINYVSLCTYECGRKYMKISQPGIPVSNRAYVFKHSEDNSSSYPPSLQFQYQMQKRAILPIKFSANFRNGEAPINSAETYECQQNGERNIRKLYCNDSSDSNVLENLSNLAKSRGKRFSEHKPGKLRKQQKVIKLNARKSRKINSPSSK
nr:unnamed protein product [Callosobruchus chinensis]